MNSILYISTFVSLILNLNVILTFDTSEITGYHFHTYFFQNNNDSCREALEFWTQIKYEVNKGILNECFVYQINYGTHGPHPIGNYETCCNSTALSRGISWFAQNRGNLSVLIHPLTRWEVIDHTDRAMFLGRSIPLDLKILSWDLGEHTECHETPNFKQGQPANKEH